MLIGRFHTSPDNLQKHALHINVEPAGSGTHEGTTSVLLSVCSPRRVGRSEPAVAAGEQSGKHREAVTAGPDRRLDPQEER